MKSSKHITLFTHSFPYGLQETFLETEILTLSNSFEKIIIIPLEGQNGVARNLPSNVSIKKPVFIDKSFIVLIQNFVKCFSNLLFIKHVIISIFNFRKLKQIFIAITFDNYLRREQIPNDKNAIWYFYWGVNLASYLALIKIKPKTIVRFHGYDLYEERKSIPFRFQLLKNIDHAVCISEHGKSYLAKKYPEFSSKIKTFKLGTIDKTLAANFSLSRNTFNIVSCSNVIPLKRVHLIASALNHVSINLNWTHFGDGPNLDQIKRQISNLQNNIRCFFPGRIPNNNVLEHYQNNEVHLFINVSSSEGIPVSIMEAISFGIPVLATDINGNVEIVNNKNGLLVEKDINPYELGKKIQGLLLNPNYNSLRIEARKKWEKEYSAEKNYQIFVKFLLEV